MEKVKRQTMNKSNYDGFIRTYENKNVNTYQ